MRRYVCLYLPDCAFEILGTNRYTKTTSEVMIVSWKQIRDGEEIKCFGGTRVNITTKEEDDFD